MKKNSVVLLLCLLLICFLRLDAGALSPEELASDCAVLMDAATGQILFEKSGGERVYPASITKIMTALLAVENTRPYEVITASKQAVAISEPASANIGLQAGEELTVESGLYALMLKSANDVANVLAEHVAGSQQAFADMMNEKARQIGATDTHFANAHGLHEEEHYTTARDMAIITRYALRNGDFAHYFGAESYTMPATNLHAGEREFSNQQYMLVSSNDLYNSLVVGGKVGLTTLAGHTMSSVAVKDKRTLVCVVMHSSSRLDKFEDTEKLIDYGFYGFYPYTISGDRFDEVNVPIGAGDHRLGNAAFRYDKDLTILLPNAASPSDLQISYEHPDRFAGEADAFCSISLQIGTPLDGLQPLGVSVSMQPTIYMDAVAVSASGLAQEAGESVFFSGLFSNVFTWIALLLFCLSGLLLMALIARRREIERKRRSREARLVNRNRTYANERAASHRGNVYQATQR